MPSKIPTLEKPELFIGIAGAIGVDTDAITNNLEAALEAVGYKCYVIKLTSEMMDIKVDVPPLESKDFYSEVTYKIKYANELRRTHKDPATLARIGIRAIFNKRIELAGKPYVHSPGTAFIIRQLKRPEEVSLLRMVYGRQFILISAYGSREHRLSLINSKLKKTFPPRTKQETLSASTAELLAVDASEDGDIYGQQLRDTFQHGDVFVDGINNAVMASNITRFVQAFFGRTNISPSRVEYGMYTAKAASLRSADLSRQVGAAIFSEDGDLITEGCNEVPRAFGGEYWDGDDPDNRDVSLGEDPNEIEKKELLRDLIDRLLGAGMLSENAKSLGNPASIVDHFTKKADKDKDPQSEDGPMVGSPILDLTEFGRVVHAEMCAICSAARLGRSVRRATLYCTTFPCHNCTKHILSSGIQRVFFMEPYPKSRAKDLHENEIEIEKESQGRVAFLPFLGISPFRYRDIFQKGKRKAADGTAKRWYRGKPQPMLEIVEPTYFDLEILATGGLFGSVENGSPPPGAGTSDQPDKPNSE